LVDYDELNIDATGIYDEDFILITTDKIEIGDSDIFLELGSVKIADLTIELDLLDILFKGVSFAGKDETFMDYLGIIFSDPENAVEDQSGFKVEVPEERPEALILFGDLSTVEEPGVVIVPGECPKQDTETETEIIVKTEPCPTVVDCPSCPSCPTVEEKVCPVLPEGTDGLSPGQLIIYLIGTLLAGGAGGVYFTRNKTLGRSGGLKTYKSRSGEIKVLHKHPGIRGYHDPSTSHREAHERHPRGQLYPHYVKDEMDVYKYVK